MLYSEASVLFVLMCILITSILGNELANNEAEIVIQCLQEQQANRTIIHNEPSKTKTLPTNRAYFGYPHDPTNVHSVR